MPKKKGKKKKKELSIILPAYNEADNIEKTIESFVSIRDSINFNVTLIVVNDGSTDATPNICQRLSSAYPFLKCINHTENIGYGGAIISGIEAAKGDYVAICDSDCRFDAADMVKLLKFTRSFDVVVGYRENRADPLGRRILGRMWTIIGRSFFNIKIRDLNCGLKVFRLSLVKGLDLWCEGPGINLEIMAHLSADGIPVKEVPCTHYPRTAGSQTGGSLRAINRAFPELIELLTRKTGSGSLLPNYGFAALLILFVFAFLLRMPNLTESLWYDEVVYSTSQRGDSIGDLWNLVVDKAPAPLYRALLFFWIKLFGEHELSVRMPSFLFGLFSIPLTFGIAVRRYSQRTALLASALLCLSPVHIWYSQEATPYAMASFFLLASIYAYYKLQNDHTSKQWYILYLGFLTTGVFTHYYSAVFLFALSFLSLGIDKVVRKKVLLIHATVLGSFAAMLVTKSLVGELGTGMGFLRPFNLLEWWMLFFNWFLHGNSLWTVSPYRMSLEYLAEHPLLITLQVSSLFIVLRGLLQVRQKNRFTLRWEFPVLLCSLPVALLTLNACGLRNLYIERYLFTLLPFFYIALSSGATGFRNKAFVSVCTFLAVTVGICSYMMVLSKNDTWTVYKQNPDWRTTVNYLAKDDRFSRGAIVLVANPTECFSHYLGRTGTERDLDLRMATAETLKESTSGGTEKILCLVINRYWGGDADKIFQYLTQSPKLKLVDSKTFKGLDVHSFISR